MYTFLYNTHMSAANTLPISQVRNQLPSLVEEADTLAKTTYITVKGRIKAAIVSAAELESMQETLEILSDPETMAAIRESEADIKAGRVYSLEQVKSELGL